MKLRNDYWEEKTIQNIKSEFTRNYHNYCQKLSVIEKYAPNDYEKFKTLIKEYQEEFLLHLNNYKIVSCSLYYNTEVKKETIKKNLNNFISFSKEYCQKIDNCLNPLLDKIYEKYQIFIDFDKAHELVDENIWQIKGKRYVNIELLAPLKTLKDSISQILVAKNYDDDIYEFICAKIITYNLTRLYFDKVIQCIFGKIKIPNKRLKEYDIKDECLLFNLNNYTLTKKELDHIIELKNSKYAPNIKDFTKFKRCQDLTVARDFFDYKNDEFENYFKKYQTLDIYPKFKITRNNPYQHIVYDSYKDDIKNLLEQRILKAIKKDKEQYLKIFTEKLIKSYNKTVFLNSKDMITINNHFLALYVNLDNDYNPYLILSCLLTILNTYQFDAHLKDKLNYAHTYLIKYKNQTTKLITYLFNQIDLENLKCYDTYHLLLTIINSIINNNQDKDSLYLIATKLEDVEKCLNQTRINEEELFKNDYYPFNKINTKNIQLEFELNMQPFYQEYVKTKVKLPLK